MVDLLLGTAALLVGLGVFGFGEGVALLHAETGVALGLLVLAGRRRAPACPDALLGALALVLTAAIVSAREGLGPPTQADRLPELRGMWHAVHLGLLTVGVVARVRGADSVALGVGLLVVLAAGNFTLFALDGSIVEPSAMPYGPALVFATAMALLARTGPSPLTPLWWAGLALLAWQGLAAVAGVDLEASRIGCTWLGASLALGLVVERRRALAPVVTGTLAATASALALLLGFRFGWMATHLGWDAALEARHGLPNVHPNGVGAFLAVAVPLLVARIRRQIAWSPCLVVVVAGLAITYSRLSWIGAAVGATVTVAVARGWLRWPARPRVPAGLASTVPVLGLALVAFLGLAWGAASVEPLGGAGAPLPPGAGEGAASAAPGLRAAGRDLAGVASAVATGAFLVVAAWTVLSGRSRGPGAGPGTRVAWLRGILDVKVLVPVGTAIALLGLLAALPTGPTLARRLGDVEALEERLVYSSHALRTFARHPALGIGANNHRIQAGYADPGRPQPMGQRSRYTFDDPHNVLLDVAQASGVGGVLALLAFAVLALRRLLLASAAGDDEGDDEADHDRAGGERVGSGRAPPAGTIGAIVTIAVLLMGGMALAKHGVLPTLLFALLGTLGAFAVTGPGKGSEEAAGPGCTRRAATASLIAIAMALFGVRPVLASVAIRHGWEAQDCDAVPEAVSAWAAAARLLPEDARTAWQRGHALLRAGELAGARAELGRAARLAPHVGLYHAHLGLAELVAGEVEAGRRALARGAELDPTGATMFWFEPPMLTHGAVEHVLGERDRARRAYLDALRTERPFRYRDYWLRDGEPADALIVSPSLRVREGAREDLPAFALSRLRPGYFAGRSLDPLGGAAFEGPGAPDRRALLEALEAEVEADLVAGRVERAQAIVDRLVQQWVYFGDPERAYALLHRAGDPAEEIDRAFRVPGHDGPSLYGSLASGIWIVGDGQAPPPIDEGDSGFAHSLRAERAQVQGRWEEAIWHRRAALAVERTPERFAEQAETFRQAAMPAEARAAARAGLRVMTRTGRLDAGALQVFARTLAGPLDRTEALALIERAVARRPWCASLHATRVAFLRALGRDREAAAATRWATAHSASSWMWVLREQVLRDTHAPDAGGSWIATAYGLDPDAPHVWMAFARERRQAGDEAVAARLLREQGPCHPGVSEVSRLANELGEPLPEGACRPRWLDRLVDVPAT